MGVRHTPLSYGSRPWLQTLKLILTIRTTAKNDQPLIAQTDHRVKRPGRFHSGFVPWCRTWHSHLLMQYDLTLAGGPRGI